MDRKSPLIVPGVENSLTRFKEEIAHEFGIPVSPGEIESKSRMHRVTEKILNKNDNKKKDDC